MGDELDDILDDALDDLANDGDDQEKFSPENEDIDSNSNDISAAVKKAAEKTHAAAETSALKAKQEQEEQDNAPSTGFNPFANMDLSGEGLENTMKGLMDDLKNPDFAKDLEGMFKMMNIDMDGEEGAETKKILESLANEDTFQDTIKKLSETAGAADGANPANTEAMGEDLMKQMMSEFEKMGQKEDFQKQIDAMMQQVVSKEVMYEPVKAVCDKFPVWLADNQGKLEKEDYERYGKQYQHFQRLVAVYDTEPENLKRIMELMQEMQEFGNPPKEIIDDVAPGMNFSNPMGNMMPGTGGNQGSGTGPPEGCPQM